jgi:hypothetical protein
MSANNESLSSFGQDLIKAAQDNPIPAALIGMGVLWWFSGGSQTSLSGANLAGPGGSALQGVSRVASQMADSGKAAIGAASATATDAGGEVGDASSRALASAGDSLSSAAGTAQRYGFAMQRDLADLLERRPLALGAVGLCLGVVAATAFPVTDAEKEMFGETSDSLKEQAKAMVSDGAGAASEFAGSVAQAASNEGASVSGAAAVGKTALKKVEAVAAKAIDAAETKISKV